MPLAGQPPIDAGRSAATPRPDVLPSDAEQRRAWMRATAQLATVYGLPSVLQHDLLRRETWGEDPRPLSTFRHERAVATPAFSAFRVPNVDTLYSSAWIDATGGPVVLELPDFGARYFTLQLLDAFAETSNLSRRTIGDQRRFVLVPPGTDPPALDGGLAVHLDSPVTWALMRIQVGADDSDAVHALQDQVRLTPLGPSALTPQSRTGDVESDPAAFFETLDAALRLQGHPTADDTLVAQFRNLGVLGSEPFDLAALDEASALGLADGFRDAMAVVSANRAALGVPTPARWTRVADKGRHGANLLNRAIMNFVGLGANVIEENTSFNTYVDAAGEPLDGRCSYEIALDHPPDCEAFWSITLYEAESGMLYDAPDGRHSLGSASGGRTAIESARIVVGHEPESDAAWLPAPRGRFFLVLRVYGPGPAVVSGEWSPPPVDRL